MPPRPSLSKTRPLIFDHTAIFKTNCKTDRAIALTSDSFNISPGTIPYFVLMQRLAETDAVSYCQRQQT